jgi:toluene monooxygenase electron transfer component
MTAYVAGPPPMVDGALRMLVLEARLDGTDIKYDKFG